MTDLFSQVEPDLGLVEPDRLGDALDVQPLTPSQEQAVAETLMELDAMAPLAALARPRVLDVLEAGFPLDAILTFLPDIKLKQRTDAAAEAALAIPVTDAGSMKAADAALGPVREAMRKIDGCFDGSPDQPGPTALANMLHKRLTGLRGDFKERGAQAVATVGQRIAAQQSIIEAAGEAERKRRQAVADEEAKRIAGQAAQQAAAAGTDPATVAELQHEAKTARAAPVAAAKGPTLANTTVLMKWKARLKGTPDDSADPNPAMEMLSNDQRLKVFEMMHAILDGKAPLSFMDLNWSAINKRAESDEAAFSIPGLESFKQAQPRGKTRR